MPSPAPLAVDPTLLADTGRQLRLMSGGATSLGAHFRGPRPSPDTGDDACTAAYAQAVHQLAGLVSAAVVRNEALGGTLGRAAAVYAVLDGTGPGGDAA